MYILEPALWIPPLGRGTFQVRGRSINQLFNLVDELDYHGIAVLIARLPTGS